MEVRPLVFADDAGVRVSTGRRRGKGGSGARRQAHFGGIRQDALHPGPEGGRPGHFLGSGQTLSVMQSVYLYPRVADRRTPGEWEETGSETLYEQALHAVGDMLASHYPDCIDAKTDARLRDTFPIRLQRSDMRAGNPRWD